MDGRPPSKRSSGLVVHREGKQFHSVKELCEDWAGLCEQIANHPLAVVRVYELVDADAGILLAECGAGALGSLAPLPEAARGEDPALESLRNSQIEDVIAQRLEKRSSRNANAEDEEHLHPHPLGGHTKKVTRRHSVGSSSHIVAAAGGVAQSSASRINAQGNQQNYAKAISAEIASEDERLERHRQQVLGFGGTNEPRFSKNAENKRRMLFQPSSRSSKNSATSAVDHVIQLDARAAHAWHTAKILHEADPICRYARALNREERRRFYSRAGESAGNVQNVLADAVQHYLPNKALRFDPLTIRAHSARLHEAADAPALREQHDDFHYYADEEVAATDNTNRADVKRSSEAMLSHAKDKDRLAGIDMLHTAVYRASVVAAARLRSESHDGTRSSAGTTELERQESSAEPTARDTTSQRSPRGQRGLQKAWDQVQKRRLLVRTTLRMVGSRDTFDFRDYFSGQSVTTRKSGVLAAPKAAEPRRISQSDRMLCTAANDPWFQFGLQALAANEPVLESTRMAFPLKTPPARKAFTSLAAMGMVVISTTDGLSLEAYARKFLGDAATSVDPRTSALSSRERMKELEIDVDRCVDSLWAMTKSLSQEWDAWNARRAKRVLEGVTFAMIHALEEVTTHEGRAYHDDILPVICSVAKELVGCERVAFWAHDPQTHQLYLKEQTGGALMRGTRISENAGMLGECMRAHAPITLAQNANAHPGYNPYTDAGGELVKIGGTVFHRGNTVENMITVPIFEYDLLSSGDAYMIGQIDQGQDAVLRGALNQANATQPGRRKTGGRRTTATSLAGRLDSKEVGGGEDASSSAFVHSAFRPTSVNVARRRRTEKVKGEDFTSFRKRVTTEALEDVLAVQRRLTPTVDSLKQVGNRTTTTNARKSSAPSSAGLMQTAMLEVLSASSSAARSSESEDEEAAGDVENDRTRKRSENSAGSDNVPRRSDRAAATDSEEDGEQEERREPTAVELDEAEPAKHKKSIRQLGKAGSSGSKDLDFAVPNCGTTASRKTNKKASRQGSKTSHRGHVIAVVQFANYGRHNSGTMLTGQDGRQYLRGSQFFAGQMDHGQSAVQFACAMVQGPLNVALRITNAVAKISQERMSKLRMWSLSEKFMRCNSVRDLIQALQFTLPHLLSCEAGCLLLHDATKQSVRTPLGIGESTHSTSGTATKNTNNPRDIVQLPRLLYYGVGHEVANSCLARAIATGLPVVVNDPQDADRNVHKKLLPDLGHDNINNLVVMPVFRGSRGHRASREGPQGQQMMYSPEEVVALLLLCNKRDVVRGFGTAGFTHEDVRGLRFMSVQLASHFNRLKADLVLEAASVNLDNNTQSLLGAYGYDQEQLKRRTQENALLVRSSAAEGAGEQKAAMLAQLSKKPDSKKTAESGENASNEHTLEALVCVGGFSSSSSGAEDSPRGMPVSWDLCVLDLRAPAQQDQMVISILRQCNVLDVELAGLKTNLTNNRSVTLTQQLVTQYCKLVRDIYLPPEQVPYHNYFHALQVAQVTFLLLREAKLLREELQKLDIVAVILAALGHDAGHRGFTNQFEVATRSDLACRYNDQSVLEMHHAAVSWNALMSTGICSSAARGPVFDTFRARFVKSILQTDMQFHGEHIREAHALCKYFRERGFASDESDSEDEDGMESMVNTSNDEAPAAAPRAAPVDAGEGSKIKKSPSKTSQVTRPSKVNRASMQSRQVISKLQDFEPVPNEKRQLVCEIFLHMGDIGIMGSKLAQSLRWTDLVLDEFQMQAEAEQRLGIPVTMFPEGLETPVKRAKTQVGFLNFVILPLYNVVHAQFPLPICMKNMRIGLRFHEKIMKQNDPAIKDYQVAITPKIIQDIAAELDAEEEMKKQS